MNFSCKNKLIEQIKSNKNTIINNVSKELTMVKEYGYIKFGKLLKIDDFSLTINDIGTYILPNDFKIIVDKNICYFETENNKMCYNVKRKEWEEKPTLIMYWRWKYERTNC